MATETIEPRHVFSDPEFASRYAEGPPRIVPGFADMHRMAALLLAERVPQNGHVLVVGAGGGLELKSFAQAQPGWTFDGFDPSAEMLEVARITLGNLADRVSLHVGTIDVAPVGPFDGASCLLILHFLTVEERLRTLAEVHRRLKPGAPFVLVHMSMPSDEDERSLWLARYSAFAISSGVDPDHANKASEAIRARLTILDPAQDEAMLKDAGFATVRLFYAGLSFRGWVCHA